MSLRLALVGPPNCGKSTLFNRLSGGAAPMGNYPGVTVERHQAAVHLGGTLEVMLLDLPGVNSLVTRSPEEEITLAELCGQTPAGAPDAVVVVADATQLGRGVALLLQVQELGLPTFLALNMADRAAAAGQNLSLVALQQALGVEVATLCARTGAGVEALIAALGPFCHAVGAASRAPRLRHLRLTTEEQATLGALQSALPAPQRNFGLALWLLCVDPLHAGAALRRWGASESSASLLRSLRREADELGPGTFVQRLITRRYAYIDGLLALAAPASQADGRDLDRFLLHPRWGPAAFVGIMFLLFQLTFSVAAPLMEAVGGTALRLFRASGAWLPGALSRSLWVDGVGAGVANVFSFVPQIGLLFWAIALLEDSGYMARAAFVADRLMRRVGLQGRAFVPLLSSFACAVPGVMACRTLAQPADRLRTIFIAPLMSCSARLPVYTLVISAVFASQPPLWGCISWGGLIILAMYALGFVAALGTAWLLERGVLRGSAPSMLLELPRLQLPRLRPALRQALRHCGDFLRYGGPLIVSLSVLLWAALTFPRQPLPPALQQQAVAALPAAERCDPQACRQAVQRQARAYALDHSLAGTLGHALEPALRPLGFDWRIGIGLVASFAAREVLVSALGQIYALDAQDPSDAASLGVKLQQMRDPQTGARRLTPLKGLSLMVFFVLAMQCLSTVATVRRETQSWTWPLAQLLYMNALAYMASLLVYQGGRALGYA